MVRNFWKLTRWARALRFWLLLLVAVAAWLGLGVGKAHAQSYTSCFAIQDTGLCPDAPTAHTEVLRMAQYRADRLPQQHQPARIGDATKSCATGTCQFIVAVIRKSGDTDQFIRRSYPEASACPAGQEWFAGTFNRCDTTCESRPAATTLFSPKSGSQQCQRGCMRSFMGNGDGETMTTQSTGGRCEGRRNDCSLIPPERGNFVWNPYLGVCEPVTAECPEGQKPVAGKCEPNDFCPVGQIVNENNVCEPREGECPAGSKRSLEGMCVNEEDDGEGQGPCADKGEVRGKDGTCKKDQDGDGEPDDEDGKFSGGDDCRVPPSCSGDTIMCGQARILWRIDCNTRRNAKISGGGCGPNSMPVCVGESCDLMQYGQLVQQWGARCALEKLANGDPGSGGPGGPGDGEGNKDPDFDPYAAGEADAASVSDDGVEASDAFTDGSENNGGAGGVPGGTGELDTGGLGYSRSCPTLPTVQVMGTTLDFNAVAGGVLCDWMTLGGYFVMVLAAFLSVRILSGGSAV